MKQLKGRFLLLGVACSVAMLGAGSAFGDSQDCLDSITKSVDSDAAIGAHSFEIICRQGDVILRGTVASEQARARVVDIAAKTDGVVSVTNWLTVGPKSSQQVALSTSRSDSAVAADIRAAIAADDQSLANKVSVSVNNGTAILSGNMGSLREADQVLATTLMVAGVQDLSSQLTINGRIYGTKITR